MEATSLSHRSKSLELLKLDPNSITPQHQQLEDQVLEAIRDGLLLPGDPLPPERELSVALGISRMTVRYALNKLKAQGHLESQAGKGWCVSPSKIEQTLTQLTGLSADMRARGLTVKSEVIEFRKVDASGKQAEDLGLLGESVYLLRRLRWVSGEPLALEKAYIPERVCPGLERFDFAQDSLYRVMQQEYDLTLARAVQVVEASTPNSHEASLLRIDLGIPVLRSTRAVYNPENHVLEFGSAAYRGDRYKYQLHLLGGAQGISIV